MNPWTFRVSPEEAERYKRTAKALGFMQGVEVDKTALVKAGLDALTARAIRSAMADAGGVVAAVDGKVRGIKTILLDAVAITGGDRAALAGLLAGSGVDVDYALDRFPDVRTAFDAARAKRSVWGNAP